MIRGAQLSDVPAIVDIGAVLHCTSTYRDIPFNRAKVAALMQSLINGAGVVFVAERDGKVVGGIAGGVAPHWFSDELQGYEYTLVVLPESRHGLISTKLVLAMKAWWRLKGAKRYRMGITTGINVDATARFYRHLGMNDAGQIFEGEL